VHAPGVVRVERDGVTSISIQVTDSGGDLKAVYWTQPKNGKVSGELRIFAEPIHAYAALLQYQPDPCWTGWDSFEVRAVDVGGSFSQAVVKVQVVDTPPRLENPTITVVAIDDAPTSFNLSAATAGNPKHQASLVYKVMYAPQWGRLEGNPPHLTFTPEPGRCGLATLEYEVQDPCGATTEGLVVIILAHTPNLAGPTSILVPASSMGTSFDVFVHDDAFLCGDRVEVRGVSASGGTVRVFPRFLHQSGWVTVTVEYEGFPAFCNDTIAITAVDSGGLSQTWQVELLQINQPPQALPPHLRGELTVTLTPKGIVRSPVAMRIPRFGIPTATKFSWRLLVFRPGTPRVFPLSWGPWRRSTLRAGPPGTSSAGPCAKGTCLWKPSP